MLLFVPIRPALRAITSRRVALGASAVWWIISLAGVVSQWTWSTPILTAYLDQSGWSGSEIISGDRDLLLPGWLFRILLLAALAAAAVPAWRAARVDPVIALRND